MAFVNTRNIDREKTMMLIMNRLLETNCESAAVIHAQTGRIKLGIAAGDREFSTDIRQSYEELVNGEIREIVPQLEQEDIRQLLSLETILQGLEKVPVYSGRNAVAENGMLRYKMWSAVYLDGSREYVLLTVTDVTEVYQEDAKRTRELQEALRAAEIASQAKTTFLARMSHEIRTPITTVAGILELIRMNSMEEELSREKLLDYVDTADTANKYLLTLINDILDIAKIEKNELEISAQPTDIRLVVRPVCAMVNQLARKKNIEMVYQRKSDTGNWYWLDGIRVQQILVNLLNNAVKFTPEGGRVIFTGECLEEKEKHALLCFTVQDTGVGISEEFKKDVFEPFRQEYTGRNGLYGGTGLGLAISRSLTRLMGGDITFESRKGEGSVFYVTLDLERAEPEKEEDAAKEEEEGSLKDLCVLLCEDNEINQMIVRSLLEVRGCRVLTANDGREALEVFQKSIPGACDLILMDIQMPHMDGLEAARRIRGLLRPDAQRIPIVAMSANAYEEDRQQSLEAGMNEHLSKPVGASKLYSTIVKYCKPYLNEKNMLE